MEWERVLHKRLGDLQWKVLRGADTVNSFYPTVSVERIFSGFRDCFMNCWCLKMLFNMLNCFIFEMCVFNNSSFHSWCRLQPEEDGCKLQMAYLLLLSNV